RRWPLPDRVAEPAAEENDGPFTGVTHLVDEGLHHHVPRPEQRFEPALVGAGRRGRGAPRVGRARRHGGHHDPVAPARKAQPAGASHTAGTAANPSSARAGISRRSSSFSVGSLALVARAIRFITQRKPYNSMPALTSSWRML